MTARETLRALAPIIGAERVGQIWRAYLIGDAIQRRELEGILEAYAAQVLNDRPDSSPGGLFPPPAPERCLGDIDIGKVLYGGRVLYPLGLRTEELLRHVGLYGSSGSGKSNGIALILDGFIREKLPFILIDFKRSFRSLLHDYQDILIFTAGDHLTAPFRFNPLVPPSGSTVDVWLKKVVGAISHSFMQGAGSESLLISALENAYDKAGAQQRWPTFKDVAEALDTQPARGRKAMWLDSARRAVGSLTSGNAADVFCPAQHTDVAQLLKKNVILEMDLLNPSEQCCLSECLLLWIIHHRMHNNKNREVLQHAIVIEEAHHLLRSPPGVGDGSEPVIHIALREIRELSECIILATQNASIVPVSVFGNQATTIAFHTKHAKDVSSTAQAMLLKDEAKDALGRLPVGEALVRIPRCPDTIHVRLQHRPIAKGSVSDADIRSHMAAWTYSTDTAVNQPSLGTQRTIHPIPAREEEQTKLPESPSAQAPTRSPGEALPPTTTPKDNLREAQIPQTSPLELAMLRDIVEHPFDGVVKRIHRLQTSRRKGTAALQALEAHGLVKPASVFTGTSLVKLFDLTKTGRAQCYSLNLGPLPEVTHGGVEHRYWVRHAAETLVSEGWQVKIEHKVSTDLTVDVHAEKDGQIMAVLVETGKSNAKKNFVFARNAGYGIVRVLPTSVPAKNWRS